VGARKKYGGKIYYDGKELNIKDPVDSVENKIAYITEDRQKLGLMLGASIIENLTVVGMQTKIKGFFVNIKNLIPTVKDIVKSLRIKISSYSQEVRSISGGNQQKVVLGKW
ncbi:MAG: sugar ABC transporter ATP-binding protein, partial [Christensenellaceae bacterium]